MEKKIERVPYISKWYKWEEDCSGEHFRLDVKRTNQYLKDELLHFDFKDEPMIKVDWLNKDTTTISYPNGMNYIKIFVNDKFSTVKDAYIILTRVKNSLGIDFIKDFIKACEKCEE